MNPIGLAALALSSGCGASLVWLVHGSRVAAVTQAVLAPREPEPELEPVNELDAAREDWNDDLARVSKELADVREKRTAAAAVRADTLRLKYLAQRGEVSAR
jgi:hypothetical protein